MHIVVTAYFFIQWFTIFKDRNLTLFHVETSVARQIELAFSCVPFVETRESPKAPFWFSSWICGRVLTIACLAFIKPISIPPKEGFPTLRNLNPSSQEALLLCNFFTFSVFDQEAMVNQPLNPREVKVGYETKSKWALFHFFFSWKWLDINIKTAMTLLNVLLFASCMSAFRIHIFRSTWCTDSKWSTVEGIGSFILGEQSV